MTNKFVVGQRVKKLYGDYRFKGYVVAVFQKLSQVERCVVENEDGILHIFNLEQLVLWENIDG